MYASTLDRLPKQIQDIRVPLFTSSKNLKSHTTISTHKSTKIWETTLPGYIRIDDIQRHGYSLDTIFAPNKFNGIVDCLIVTQLFNSKEFSKLFNFIDSLALNKPYPSEDFYLRKQLYSVDKLLENREVNEKQHHIVASKIINRLLALNPSDVDLKIQKAKILVQNNQQESFAQAFELLNAIPPIDIKNQTIRVQQQIMFIKT